MNPHDEQRTPEEEAFYKEWKNKPPTEEELEFWANLDKHEWVPAEVVLAELKEIVRRKRQAGQ